MDSSILNSIKEMLDVEADDSSFDTQITIFINSALSILREVGCGNLKTPFTVKDSSTTWEEFLGEDSMMLEFAKEFIYLDVKLKFDPPTNSYLTDVLSKARDEDLFRINHEYEIATPIEG